MNRVMSAAGRHFSVVPAPLIVILAGISTYVGAGFAVALFAVMPPATVAWWRVAIGAVVLVAWRRPWRRQWTWRALLVASLFGIAMATMNVIFYSAIEYIALGTAVSLEFLGPVMVAVVTGRGWRPRVAAGLALAGVMAISGLGMDVSVPEQRVGLVLAISAGLAWAVYMLLGRRVAASGAGLDSLAVGSAAGALVYVPLAWPTAHMAWSDGVTALKVLGVAVMSTVVPYGLDQLNLGRLNAATFALLSALMPATSLLVGVVMLRQMPHMWEVNGLVLVSIAVALAGAHGSERRRLRSRIRNHDQDLT